MSIFDNIEQEMLEKEKEESEIALSNERQFELDKLNEENLKEVNNLIEETESLVINENVDEDIKNSSLLVLTALKLLRDKLTIADRNINDSNTVVKMPEGFYLRQTVYMIPTPQNGLKDITSYHILSFGTSQIGPRVDLAIDKKQAGVESLYCANFGMFNKSIFASLEEAQAHYNPEVE